MGQGSPEDGWEYRERTEGERQEWIGASQTKRLKEREELRNNGPLQKFIPQGSHQPIYGQWGPSLSSLSLSLSFSDSSFPLLCYAFHERPSRQAAVGANVPRQGWILQTDAGKRQPGTRRNQESRKRVNGHLERLSPSSTSASTQLRMRQKQWSLFLSCLFCIFYRLL